MPWDMLMFKFPAWSPVYISHSMYSFHSKSSCSSINPDFDTLSQHYDKYLNLMDPI